MAGKKFTKGSEEWQMFMDFWNLCQKYWEPEESDDYWSRLFNECNAFFRKYASDFARGLAKELMDDVERRNK